VDFNTPIVGRYVRVVAILSLLIGLADAARLLGVSSGDANPIDLMGITGFVFTSVFSMARLFAAVGLWIRASWGAVLLLAATIVELGMYLLGNRAIQFSALDFAVRMVLLVAIVLIFVVAFRFRQRAQD
jgi:hypothetical protein